MAGDEVPPQQSIRTIELPLYPPFNEHESPSIATDWEEWIEGLDAMFDAMCLTNDQDKFSKLYHYLGNTRRTLKKLDDNGIPGMEYNRNRTLVLKLLSQHTSAQNATSYSCAINCTP